VRQHDLRLGFVEVWEERLNVRLACQGVTARLSGQLSIDFHVVPDQGEYKTRSQKLRLIDLSGHPPHLQASRLPASSLGKLIRSRLLQYLRRSARTSCAPPPQVMRALGQEETYTGVGQ
jgi:hypothetical protein